MTEIPENTPQYLEEFPDFGPMDVEIPEGFVDVSWHNEACPCFVSEETGTFLFVDYADLARREDKESTGVRFSLHVGQPSEHGIQRGDGDDLLIATDDFTEIVDAIASRRSEMSVRPSRPAP